MQKKKVLVLTYGNSDHASSRIRAINHFKRLRQYYDVTWIPRTGIHRRNNILQKTGFALLKKIYGARQLLTILFYRFDIAFIQVMFLPAWCLKILARRNTLICYDFDDAVYTYSKKNFEIMLHYSHKVIVATPLLQQFIEPYGKESAVIFSPVDTELIVPAKTGDHLFTIGWIGSPWTVQYLKTIEAIFLQLAATTNFKVLVIGANISIPGVNVECMAWSEENELLALQRIDIGIMPLKNDEWSKMKGGYKLYLYMAAGKAVVASPYGINATIVKNGINGFLAASEAEWLNAFKQLALNKALTMTLGKNARDDAEANYSYKVCTAKLFQFLNN